MIPQLSYDQVAVLTDGDTDDAMIMNLSTYILEVWLSQLAKKAWQKRNNTTRQWKHDIDLSTCFSERAEYLCLTAGISFDAYQNHAARIIRDARRGIFYNRRQTTITMTREEIDAQASDGATVGEAVQLFINRLGMSAKHRTSYRIFLGILSEQLGPDTPAREITRDMLAAYCESPAFLLCADGTPKAVNTLKVHRSVLRSLITWLQKTNHIEKFPLPDALIPGSGGRKRGEWGKKNG